MFRSVGKSSIEDRWGMPAAGWTLTKIVDSRLVSRIDLYGAHEPQAGTTTPAT